MLHARPAQAPPFSGSYAPEDVTFLLKPVELRPTGVAAKEALIQSGRRHYSEMIAPEDVPGEAYLALYRAALSRNAPRLAGDVAALAAALAGRAAGRPVVIASLARAGTPIGVLLARALRRIGVDTAHYSISIIRDRGIDREALAHIAARHAPEDVVFVDGWTGKGVIADELRRSLASDRFGFPPFLAVVADPAGAADLAATADDYLIPSGILNGIVSGLVSRSILNARLVGPGDFHACVHYRHLAPHDLSRSFVDTIDALAAKTHARPIGRGPDERRRAWERCAATVAEIEARYGIADRNRIKPGIAEATRAVLRRVPDRLLVRDPAEADVAHLMRLAREKQLAVELLPPGSHYRAAAIIRALGKDGGSARHGRD